MRLSRIWALEFSFAISMLISTACATVSYRVEAKDYDVMPIVAQISKKIMNSHHFTKRGIKIYISSDSYANRYLAYTNGKNSVFLSHRLLLSYENQYLDVIIAHELGHIQYETADQNLANLFAARVVSKSKVMEWLRYIKVNHLSNSRDEEIDAMIEYLENQLLLK